MKKILIIVIATAIITGTLGAESITLTVDQAVDLAIAQNLGLKQSGIDVRTRERAKDTAWNAFLPSMSASAGFNSTAGIFQFNNVTPPAITDPGALGFTTGLNLSLPINAAVSTGIKNLVASYEAGMISYEDAQMKLERDVRKQFYLLLGSQENIKIQEGNIALAEKRLTQARNNFDNGLAPELEVLSAEVTVANLQPAYNGTVAAYESLMLFFRFLLGEDRAVDIALNGHLETELYNLDSDNLINSYISNRLDIRGLDKQIEALGYAKKTLNRNFNTPTLLIGGSWGLSGSNSETSYNPPGPIDPWTDWNDRFTLSLNLQWKFDGLIPGSKSDVQVSEMQDAIDSLSIAKQMAFESAGMEITNLVNKLDTSRKTIEANTSSVELARRNYELTEEAYNVGTRELLDVESRQQDYLNAAQQLLLAKYEYIAGLLDLEYALNAPMDEFLTR
ncbi:MAG: TolC family protein [Spirochaetaceae bacterium]|nr:TolC family protein [Spirochaetaceae bacterium]